jgi:hypothetical protein
MRKPIHLPLGKGIRGYCWIALCLCFSPIWAQQCPFITNCPQSTPTLCDESTNDIDLWNNAPYTFSPIIGSTDMPETALDLNIRLKGCNQGGLGIISYTLYLDLDNDGIQETVVTSANPPPPGCVMANNLFNPGFLGGDTVRFDQRPLPDSLLYRFALEIDYSGDTTIGWMRFCTDADPFDFVQVILPEGRHRVEWRTSQDDEVRFCDRNIKVKDCKAPDVSCNTGMAVYLDVTQSAVLHLREGLLDVSDNISPDSQLVLGIRRVGAGMGFPLDAMGNAQDTVMFYCDQSENQFVEIWAQDGTGNVNFCTTQVLVYDTSGFCPLLPFSTICARTYWNQEIVKDVAFKLRWQPQGQAPVVSAIGTYSSGCTELASTPITDTFSLSAEKLAVPLNGVTTFDLVLISKHILGLEPFNAAWKITAADANRSNSVTTFDIVELRKLILGLTDKLPNNTPSWRFFVDTCMAWGHPFFNNCPPAYELPLLPISFYPPNLSFRGVKIGDVNGTASAVDTLLGSAEPRGGAAWLEMPDQWLQTGETIDIPIRSTQTDTWEGLQFSLQYDAEKLDIQAVLPTGALDLTTENWAIPQPGELNLSWSDARPSTLLPGDELFRLRLKAHAPLQLSQVFKLPEQARIEPEAYDTEGVRHPLGLLFNKHTSSGAANTQLFAPIPNPTAGSANLPLRLNAPENVWLEIRDFAGHLQWQQEISLDAGMHQLEFPAAAMSQAGVYVWHIRAGAVSESGRLIRL